MGVPAEAETPASPVEGEGAADMNFIFLDFETFFGDDYTLKKMSTEAYIRDPRFEVQLMAVAINNSPVEVFEPHQIPIVLDALPMHEPDTMTIMHNAKFDGSVLAWRYGRYISRPICTRPVARWAGPARLVREALAALAEFFGVGQKGEFLQSMAGRRLVDLTPWEKAEYKKYNAGDTEILRAIFWAMLPHCTQDCLDFISMTESMYLYPMLQLNGQLLREYYQKLVEKNKEAMAKINNLFCDPAARYQYTQAYPETDVVWAKLNKLLQYAPPSEFMKAIRSPKIFPEMLTALGVPVPLKISEKKTSTKHKKAAPVLTELIRYKEMLEAGYVSPNGITYNDVLASIQNLSTPVFIPAVAKTDPEFIALQEDDDDENVATLCQIRAENNSSIAMSRTLTFLEISMRGALPVALESFQAISGRYTAANATEGARSDGTNIQNLAKRTGDKTLRYSIIAPEGYKLVAADSSQIEARFGAYFANEQRLISAFARGDDPYSDLAGEIYHCDPEEVKYYTKGPGADETSDLQFLCYKRRDIGKRSILGQGYGLGGRGFGIQLRAQKTMLADTEEEHFALADHITQVYQETYPAIPASWKRCGRIIIALIRGESGWFGGPFDNLFYFDGNHQVFGRRVPGIRLPDGLWILFPNLRELRDEFGELIRDEYGRIQYVFDQMVKGRMRRTKLYGSMLHALLTQGGSFAALRWQALRINETLPWDQKLKMNVHDEWLTVVLAMLAEWVASVFEYWMKQAPEWCQGMPFDCEVKIGDNYGKV